MKEDNLQPTRLYRELLVGEQTIIGCDPADANDFCSAVVCSKKNLDFPLVFNQVTNSAQFGYEIYNIAKYVFNITKMWPRVAVERNTGMSTIYVLKELNYPDLFRMVDPSAINSHEGGGIGWVTTGHWSGGELGGSRRKILDDIAQSIKQGYAKMYDIEQIKQFKSFMLVRGRAQARSNKKDDLVMATAIAWQVQQLTPSVYLDNFDEEAFKKEKMKWRFK